MRLSLFNLLSRVSTTILIVVCLFGWQVNAQTSPRTNQVADNRPRTASIGGRVTVGGKPAANAMVLVMEVDPRSRGDWYGGSDGGPQKRAFIKVRTDGDGRYQVTGLPEGFYMVRALSKAYVRAKNPSDFDIFSYLKLDEGESRNDVDIALVRGGVITGRVTDAEGAPLIYAYMDLAPVDENGKAKEHIRPGSDRMWSTDDRGMYRLYGLPAGRYHLCANSPRSARRGKGRPPRTCYPDAMDQNQAKAIEVKEGDEVTGIDIRLGEAKSGYEVTGRVIDADTKQPLPQMLLLCLEAPDKENGRNRSSENVITDEEGRFTIKGLSSGRYDLGLWNRAMGNKDYYTDKTEFEVQGADVTGLVVKAIRGSTISGVVIVEGVNDAAVKAKLQQVELGLYVKRQAERSETDWMYWDRENIGAKIATDGSFLLTGASPGMASFYVWGAQENAFSIKRIERNGAEVRSDFEIKRGEQVSGVRVVLVYASGTIRGQVEIGGGRLPEGWSLTIEATSTVSIEDKNGFPAFQRNPYFASADDKGRFVIERMVAGEYSLKLTPRIRVGQNEWKTPPGMDNIEQRVTVNNGAETQVKFTLDPARKQEDR
jgi:hypothetical protein